MDSISKNASRILTALLFVYALCLMSIGINKEWALVHEDDGAIYTTHARSHLVLGVKETRFHDIRYNPHTQEKMLYGHHPPLCGLILAGVFYVLDCDQPWVVRSVSIAFHLMNLGLFLWLTRRFFSPRDTLIAGFIWATLPISSFYGRVFTQITLALFPIMLQLVSYYFVKTKPSKIFYGALFLSIFLGGLIDWVPLHFTLAILIFEIIQVIRKRGDLKLCFFLAVSGLFVFVFDMVHLAWAGNWSLTPFLDVLHRSAETEKYDLTVFRFILRVLEFVRRYYSHMGLIAGTLVLIALTFHPKKIGEFIFGQELPPLLKSFLIVSFFGGFLHVFAAPKYSYIHHTFYFLWLPFGVWSLLLFYRGIRNWVASSSHKWAYWVLIIFWIEVGASSFHMLQIRHTRPLSYVKITTDQFRADYLLPKYLEEKGK